MKNHPVDSYYYLTSLFSSLNFDNIAAREVPLPTDVCVHVSPPSYIPVGVYHVTSHVDVVIIILMFFHELYDPLPIWW